MKFITTLIFFLTLFSITSNAQIETVIWQNCLGTDDGLNWTDAAEKTEDGYLFGIDLQKDGPGVTNYHGKSDVWIVKTDFTGNIVWERCFGGSEGDGSLKIINIDDNTYYLINSSWSNDGDVQNGRDGNFWIVKINGDGEILWENSYGGTINGENIMDAILMPDRGLLMMGLIRSAGGDITNYYGNMDVWLCRIDSVGNIIWQKTIGNQGADNGLKIKLTSHNTILFVGSHELFGGMIDCPDIGYYVYPDVWIVELDFNGNFINQWCYGGKYPDQGCDIIEVEGGFVVAGMTYSNDRDVSGFHGTPGGTWNDIWVFKIDIYGNLVWQKCLGGLASEWPVYLTQTDDSGFIIIGNSFSLDGDVTGNHSISSTYSDIWVIKLSEDSELQWNHCFGGLGPERFWGIHSVLKKDDYNYVIGANANYLSDDVECDLFPDNLQYNAWLLEIKDCDYYKPHVPVITSGPDTVCSTVTASSMYTIETAAWATGYEWLLIPEGAGTITSDSLSAEITWNLTYEGTAEVKARGTNDCGNSEWSEARCVRVHTCLGVDEHGGMEAWGHGGVEGWPNPVSQVLSVKSSVLSSGRDCELVIYDIFGRTALSLPPGGGRAGDGGFTIDVSALPAGIYLAVVKDKKGVVGSAKFVVARP